MTEPEHTRGAGLVAIVVAVTGFSWGFILIKSIDLPPPVLATWRLMLGAIALTLVAVAWRVPWPRARIPVVLAGLAFGAHQLLFIAATKLTSVAIVTLMGAALQPLLVGLVSRRAVGEPVPRALFAFAGVAAVGVGVVVHASFDDPSRSLQGDLLALVNVLAFTTFFLATKRARLAGAHTLTLTAGFLWVATAVVAPVGLWWGMHVPTAPEWGLLALLALGSGNGHLLVNWAHARVSAALASIVLSILPLLASLWAHLVLGEPYTWRHMVGIGIVVIAIEGARRADASTTDRKSDPGFGPARPR